jgi:hypothetical protein
MHAGKPGALVVIGVAVLALAGCGAAGSARIDEVEPPAASAGPTPAADPTTVCHQAAQTSAKGYGIEQLVAARSTTAAAFTAWHGPAPRSNGVGPLDGKAPSTPATLCLWKADNLAPSYPPPPPGVRRKPLVFDGVEVLVTDSGTSTHGCHGSRAANGTAGPQPPDTLTKWVPRPRRCVS